jgi:hypothetical protein
MNACPCQLHLCAQPSAQAQQCGQGLETPPQCSPHRRIVPVAPTALPRAVANWGTRRPQPDSLLKAAWAAIPSCHLLQCCRPAVGAGCIIAAGADIGDKTSVKRSVIGPGCVLGSNVKVGRGLAVCCIVIGT